MTKEEIQKIYDYSKSKQDIIRKLNINSNLNCINLDKDILKYFSIIGINSKDDLKISNLKKHWLNIQKRDYELNPKYCLNCGKIIPFNINHRNFCSNSCRATYTNLNRGKFPTIVKEKISKSLTKYNKEVGHCNIIERLNFIKKYYNNLISFDEIKKEHPEIIKKCKTCGKEFIPKLLTDKKYSKSKYCSIECHNMGVSNNSKKTYIKCIENGTFKGWQSRNILSYPEKFWTKVLENNNIEYISNKPVKQENNISCYFLDFYIEIDDRKIDLEIDGKQHKYKDRLESDKRRDEYLKSLGYEVYRIEWILINSEIGKEKMKEKIDLFLKYINKQS